MNFPLFIFIGILITAILGVLLYRKVNSLVLTYSIMTTLAGVFFLEDIPKELIWWFTGIVFSAAIPGILYVIDGNLES